MAQMIKYKGTLYQRVDNSNGYVQEAQEALAILHGARSAITKARNKIIKGEKLAEQTGITGDKAIFDKAFKLSNEIDSAIAKTEFELAKLK